MASSTSGQAGLAAESRKKDFPESHIINPLLTKLVRSRWVDIGVVLFLWTSTASRSINSQKKNLANIQPSWSHTWSITYMSWRQLYVHRKRIDVRQLFSLETALNIYEMGIYYSKNHIRIRKVKKIETFCVCEPTVGSLGQVTRSSSACRLRCDNCCVIWNKVSVCCSSVD